MKSPRAAVGAGLATLALMVALFAAHPWVLDRLELSLLDWRFRLRGAIPAAERIVLIAIDEPSIDRLGRWPWRRDVVARLVDRLVEADVEAIGLDIVFSEPEIPPERATLEALERAVGRAGPDPGLRILLDRALARSEPDRILAESIERSARSALGYFFRTQGAADPDALGPGLESIRRSRVTVARLPADGRAPILKCAGIEANLDRFNRGARRLGFFSSLRDRDGVVRRAPLIASCGGSLYVSLPVALLELVSGTRAVVLGDGSGVREIRVGERSIATDEGGRILVNFRGPGGAFRHYPAADVLAGTVGKQELAGTIAIVGATEIGIGDIVATPFGSVFPGPEIHANVLDNLLTGDALRRHDGLLFAELAILIALGLLVSVLGPALRTAARGAALALGLLVALLGGAHAAFLATGTWLNVTYPALTLLSVYLVVTLTLTRLVESRARTIRRQFATYVPPQIVDQMVENPDDFRLGTERRTLSILFSDIRDFTAIAEDIGATDVSRLLNAYLTPMSRIVFETRGTLDKYIGDALVAFWGAPMPIDDHAALACSAALAMQQATDRLRRTRFDLPGVERLRIGIGIHAAEVVVGHMGSEIRRAYTISGDGVNLCSRLEGLTRFYGVEILASQDLVTRLRDRFPSRELDTVRVKGRGGSVRIFEILAGSEKPTDAAPHLAAYAAGLSAYRAARWDEAEERLREALALRDGGDGPSRVLLARIPELRDGTPSGWDGTWVFQEK